MTDNYFDDSGLDEISMHYARLHYGQVTDPAEVAGSAAAISGAPGQDFAHATCANLPGISEIRSWAVQPTAAIWRNLNPGNQMQAVEWQESGEIRGEKSNSAGVSRFIRWIKFNAVGALGIAVQMVALFLLKSVLHLNYLVATAFAVEAAVVHNFFWHERFTWVDRVRAAAQGVGKRMLRFNLTTGGVSIVGNLALMKLLAGMAHMNYFAANVIAIALCSLANFVASDEWVFEG